MLANPVLRTSLSFPRMVLVPFMPITSFVISIGLLIPILSPLYALIMSIIWLPFSYYIKVTGLLYREIFFFRPILALITIPLLIVLDIFIIIMPGVNKHDKYEKASMIDTWPYKMKRETPDVFEEQSIPKTVKAKSCSIDVTLNRVKVRECTLCGDMVRADWTQCPSCHEPLDAVLPLRSTQYSKTVLNKNDVSQLWLEDQLEGGGMSWLKECTLCGDMVRADWRKCPRCGEMLVRSRQRAVMVH